MGGSMCATTLRHNASALWDSHPMSLGIKGRLGLCRVVGGSTLRSGKHIKGRGPKIDGSKIKKKGCWAAGKFRWPCNHREA